MSGDPSIGVKRLLVVTQFLRCSQWEPKALFILKYPLFIFRNLMDTSSLPLSSVSQRFVSIAEGSSGVLRKDSFAKVKKFLQKRIIFLWLNKATSTVRNNNTAPEKTWIPACPLAKQPSLLQCQAQGNYLLVLGNGLLGGWLAGPCSSGKSALIVSRTESLFSVTLLDCWDAWAVGSKFTDVWELGPKLVFRDSDPWFFYMYFFACEFL